MFRAHREISRLQCESVFIHPNSLASHVELDRVAPERNRHRSSVLDEVSEGEIVADTNLLGLMRDSLAQQIISAYRDSC